MTLKQQAAAMSGVFLTLLVLGVVVKMGKGPDSLTESDAMRARRDPRRRVQKPEWLRRWEKKMARLQGMG